MSLEVKIKAKREELIPAYKTEGSAGMDLKADIEKPITLRPLARVLVPTGIFIELLPGMEGQIRPRSGKAKDTGVTVLNAPGTVDSDFRGEVKVLLINLSERTATIEPNERIAQLVVAHFDRVTWVPAERLEDSFRGEGGFGSTGSKDEPADVTGVAYTPTALTAEEIGAKIGKSAEEIQPIIDNIERQRKEQAGDLKNPADIDGDGDVDEQDLSLAHKAYHADKAEKEESAEVKVSAAKKTSKGNK